MIFKNKVITFYRTEDRDALLQMMREFKKNLPVPTPENNKDEILKAVYTNLGYNVRDNKIDFLDKNMINRDSYIFDLEGTNYWLFLNKGNPSLIFKEIENDLFDEETTTHSLTKTDSPDKVHSLINTKKYLSIYGKEYEILDKKSSISGLRITRYAPSSKVDKFETLHIQYSTPYTYIFDIARVSREELISSLKLPSSIEYENFLVEHERAREDFGLTKQQIEIERNKQNQQSIAQ